MSGSNGVHYTAEANLTTETELRKAAELKYFELKMERSGYSDYQEKQKNDDLIINLWEQIDLLKTQPAKYAQRLCAEAYSTNRELIECYESDDDPEAMRDCGHEAYRNMPDLPDDNS